MHLRPAEPSDNEGLLHLTSTTPMEGEISIRIDRRPDFFRLLDRRGKNYVLIAEEGGNIVGCISTARVTVHVDGQCEDVHYLGDFKVDPDHQRTGLALRLIRSMHMHMRANGADLVMFTAAYGNTNVSPFFDGRAGLPKVSAIGLFKVCQILPSSRERTSTAYVLQEEAEHHDLCCLYNDYFRSYQFGPFFSSGSLRESRSFLARSQGQLLAAISITDVGDAKQNVLIRLPYALGITGSLLRIFGRIFPVAEFPERNSPIRILYVKALACRQGHEAALDFLIQKARNIAFEQHYHFLSIGVHERDPLLRRLSKYPRFTFKSLGFVVSLMGSRDVMSLANNLIPYEDYSLV